MRIGKTQEVIEIEPLREPVFEAIPGPAEIPASEPVPSPAPEPVDGIRV